MEKAGFKKKKCV